MSFMAAINLQALSKIMCIKIVMQGIQCEFGVFQIYGTGKNAIIQLRIFNKIVMLTNHSTDS